MLASSRWLRRCALAIIPTLSLFAVVAPASSADASERQRERKIHHAVAVARHQIGDPYRYGAAGPDAFDCSGLTMYAFRKAGINLSRSSASQASQVRRIPRHSMRTGDLMFFYGSGGIYHVGIYIGFRDGQRTILHSSKTGRPVQRDAVWTSSWFGGTLRVRA